MARVRTGGGSTGSIWGLVIFGAGFFICLILAIVFYTQVQGAQQAAQQAQSNRDAIIRPTEENNATVAALAADGTAGSVVFKLLQRIDTLTTDVNRLTGQVATLQGELSTEKAAVAQANTATTTAQSKFSDAVADKNAIEQQLNQQVQSLSTKIDAISAENTRLSGLIDKSVQELEQTYAAQIQSSRDQVAEKDTQLAQLNNTVADLKNEVEALRPRATEREAVTQADAQIMAMDATQNKVYLDLGRNQNLLPGMSFQVFAADQLVKITDPTAVGKAVVEIISVDADTSVGRVVEQVGRTPVREGDQLVNIVFDPNRVFAYHVYGQFDLDNDGVSDESDLRAIRSMVQRFGGKLGDSISFSTDYVVLGIEPEFPQKPADELDLIAMREYRVLLENYQAYQDRLTQASALNIPVLNQNRFLDLIGYHDR